MRDKAKRLKERVLKLPKPNPSLKIARRIFGFENSKKEKYLKSKLDEMQVAIELATMRNDINWIKRILWIIAGGSGAGFYFS